MDSSFIYYFEEFIKNKKESNGLIHCEGTYIFPHHGLISSVILFVSDWYSKRTVERPVHSTILFEFLLVNNLACFKPMDFPLKSILFKGFSLISRPMYPMVKSNKFFSLYTESKI